MSSKTTNKIFFPNLEGLRFLAFSLVYIHHSLLPFYLEANGNEETWLRRIIVTVTSGETLMPVFFVMSGFLITYLILHEKESRQKLNLFNFYKRRFLRIFPLYFPVIIFAVLIYPYLKEHFGRDPVIGTTKALYYFTFLSNFEQIRIVEILQVPVLMQAVTWSVSVEEQFYLIWPLLFWITGKRGYKYIFFVTIAASLIFRYVNRADPTILYLHSLSVCGDLAVGGAFAYCALYSKKFISIFENINSTINLLVYLSGAGWLIFLNIDFQKPGLIVFERLGTTLFLAYVIFEQIYNKNSFYKFSNSKFLTFWGKYTYGLYLLHPIAIRFVEVVTWKVLPFSNYNTFSIHLYIAILGYLVSLASSFISYEFYEKKFLRLKR